MKHTKGNWNWFINNGDKYLVESHSKEKELSIDICMLGDTVLDDESEIKANAKLIAAAPDLLAALRQTVKLLDPGAIVMDQLRDIVLYDALNTIKKATE